MFTAEGELVPSPIWAGLPALQLHFGYNHWAYERIWAKMAELTIEELNAPQQTSFDSAFKLMIFALYTEWSWRIVCQEGRLPPVLWQVESFPTLDSVVRFWRNEHAQMHAYLYSLKDSDLDRDIDHGTIQGSQPESEKLLQLLTKLLAYSHNHRAELAAYLTKCGRSPGSLDSLDYLEQAGA